jgi:hypothetical protein
MLLHFFVQVTLFVIVQTYRIMPHPLACRQLKASRNMGEVSIRFDTEKKDSSGPLRRLWNSTNTELGDQGLSVLNLAILTRTSFSTSDYLGDILKSAKQNSNDEAFGAVFYISAISILFGTFAVPFLPIPESAKNAFSLSIFFPFIALLLSVINPNWRPFERRMSDLDKQIELERVAFHEAGHMLAGYLCGIPMASYSIDSDVIAQTSMELPASASNLNDFLEKKANLFVIVALSGVVAETLRFGDSKGGVADIQLAGLVHQMAKRPGTNREAFLRWGLGKALTLLRLYRDELDAVADVMMKGGSVEDCFDSIEQTSLEKDKQLVVR